MNEQEALSRMVAPGTRRPGKYREGVIQIHVTRACDKQCFGCTQGSQLGGNPGMITVEQFEQAVVSLKGYFGVVGVFGGNPAIHPRFEELCDVLARHIPWEQRGLWCNSPINESKAIAMRRTFNPAVSNLNVHMDVGAFEMFRRYWPESRPVGLVQDSRHSPCYVAMKDVLKKECPACDGEKNAPAQWAKEEMIKLGGYSETHTYSNKTETVYFTPEGKEIPFKTSGLFCSVCEGEGQVYDEGKAWELISRCDINQHWSAMVGVFRGEVRAWFCEVAGAQAMLHQHEEDYPDTGVVVTGLDNQKYADGNGGWVSWWELPISAFANQVRKHCHECSVPLRGYGELAQASNVVGPDGSFPQEQASETHRAVFKPKDKNRRVQLVTLPAQLEQGRIQKMTAYLQNSDK